LYLLLYIYCIYFVSILNIYFVSIKIY